MNTLFLRLEGPLQSWGLRAHWEERDTADAPTKSGVIGLLGCARGLQRGAEELRVLSRILYMGVRVDLPGTRLTDYHTTGGAKATDGEPEGLISADGKTKRETDLSQRSYLADASFLVALHGSSATIEDLANALQHPVWPCFLGRKSCVPAVPIFAGVGQYEHLEDALKDRPFWPRMRERAGNPIRLRLLLEVDLREIVSHQKIWSGTINRQNDNIGTPSRRVFRPRYVREEWWTLPLEAGGEATSASINTLEG